MKRLTALLAVFILVAAACGDDDEPAPAAEEAAVRDLSRFFAPEVAQAITASD